MMKQQKCADSIATHSLKLYSFIEVWIIIRGFFNVLNSYNCYKISSIRNFTKLEPSNEAKSIEKIVVFN